MNDEYLVISKGFEDRRTISRKQNTRKSWICHATAAKRRSSRGEMRASIMATSAGSSPGVQHVEEILRRAFIYPLPMRW